MAARPSGMPASWLVKVGWSDYQNYEGLAVPWGGSLGFGLGVLRACRLALAAYRRKPQDPLIPVKMNRRMFFSRRSGFNCPICSGICDFGLPLANATNQRKAGQGICPGERTLGRQMNSRKEPGQ
jgi:hypothetical protein